MGRLKEVKDKKRNLIFAAAFDELRRREGKMTQLELAKRMGVNKDTITNILHYKTAVTDDIITKLQTASHCIFNLQWLRGESDIMLSEEIGNSSEMFGNQKNDSDPQGLPDYSSMINIILSAHAQSLETKDAQLADKQALIDELRTQLAKRDQQIEDLQSEVQKLRTQRAIDEYPHPIGVADDGGVPLTKRK